MAKKRRKMRKAAAAAFVTPSFGYGITPVCIGAYSSSVVWADANGKLWQFEINDATVREVKVIIANG